MVPRRPGYLVAALLAMLLVGLDMLQEGWGSLELLKNPFTDVLGGVEGLRESLISAMAVRHDTELPLAIGHMMLGTLLSVTSVNWLLSGRVPRTFALQVVLAALAFLCISYVLREPLRVVLANALAAGTEDPQVVAERAWWVFRMHFSLSVTALSLSAFALTRPAVRAFSEALRQCEPSEGHR